MAWIAAGFGDPALHRRAGGAGGFAEGDEEEGDEEDGAQDLPGALGVGVVGVIMAVVVGGSGGGGDAGFEFGAVGGVFVAVGGVEGSFEGQGAAADEGEGVGALGDDLVGGEEAADDFDGAVVYLADDHRGLDEGVGEIEVFDVDEARGGIALEGGAGDGGDVGTRGDDDRELGSHAGAEGEFGILDVEGGFNGAGRGIGEGAEVFEVGEKGFAGGGGDGDAGLLAGAEAAGEVFGHAGDGVDLGEVENLGEDFVGADGFAGDDVGGADEAGDGRGEADSGRRVFELAALDDDGEFAFGDKVIVFDEDRDGAAGDSTADDGAAPGINLDAAEGENGFLELAGFGDGGLETEIRDADGVEDDGRGGLGGDQRSEREKEG